ncbi:SRPBCC family protein [Tardiphaga sp. 215_C5_N2_1]|uniref:SRPBCC family protein n=1 Tax=Tardiphaga sp. 215_C5_N2_1 TaxID=3240774 RepID=UPI003F8AD3C0
MEMKGQQQIAASREVVWAALNNPDVLKACIPGCQELTKTSDTEMTAIAVIKVGPVSAKFQGAVTLSDLNPPNGYRITGEGQGGVAGFAKGSAVIRLEERDGETLLSYEVSSEIGGKLAQLGGRLIDATARKMSDAFFKKFSEEIRTRASGSSDIDAPAAPSGSQGRQSALHQQGAAGQAAPAIHRPHLVAAAPQSDKIAQALLSAILVAIIAIGLWLITNKTSAIPTMTPAPSFEFVAALFTLIVAAIGYLLGRIQSISANVGVHLDPHSFHALLLSQREGD